jgi:hypothetical protein
MFSLTDYTGRLLTNVGYTDLTVLSMKRNGSRKSGYEALVSCSFFIYITGMNVLLCSITGLRYDISNESVTIQLSSRKMFNVP